MNYGFTYKVKLIENIFFVLYPVNKITMWLPINNVIKLSFDRIEHGYNQLNYIAKLWRVCNVVQFINIIMCSSRVFNYLSDMKIC